MLAALALGRGLSNNAIVIPSPPSGFAWEYLRRDDEQSSDFERVTTAASLSPAATTLEAFLPALGVRFPTRRPAGAGLIGGGIWIPSLQP